MAVMMVILVSFTTSYSQEAELSDTKQALKVFEKILEQVERQNELIVQSMQTDSIKLMEFIKKHFTYFLLRTMAIDDTLRGIINSELEFPGSIDFSGMIDYLGKNLPKKGAILDSLVYTAEDSLDALAFNINLNDPLAKRRLQAINVRIEQIAEQKAQQKIQDTFHSLCLYYTYEYAQHIKDDNDRLDYFKDNVWEFVLDIIYRGMEMEKWDRHIE